MRSVPREGGIHGWIPPPCGQAVDWPAPDGSPQTRHPVAEGLNAPSMALLPGFLRPVHGGFKRGAGAEIRALRALSVQKTLFIERKMQKSADHFVIKRIDKSMA